MKNKDYSNAPPKKIIWREEYDMVMPFCPSCIEPAYEKDECVFCHQKFIWVNKPKGCEDVIVEYKNYRAIQVYGSWGLYIEKDENLIAHYSCSRPFTEQELLDKLKKYENGDKK